MNENTLLNGFPEKMAIIDCETTGGKATKDRITELAIILVDKGVVVDRWQSLFNPQTSIPPWITNITGITNQMVSSAPLFEDTWPSIFEKLKDRIFVAHNARFDYGFIKNEVSRLGQSFSAKTLCSVKLSRQLYPQFRKHSLDEVIKRLRCHVNKRHRAMDDAEVIHLLFTQMQLDFDEETIDAACNRLLKRPSLPSQLDESEINKLPDTPGVYYFYNDNARLLYVGKSVNIKTRVLSHFYQDHQNSSDHHLSHQLHHIDYKETPTDFGAQILEAQEVKQKKPSLNRRLKKVTSLYQYQLNTENDYKTIKVVQTKADQPAKPNSENYGLFRSRRQAQRRLEKLVDEHFLCHRLTGLEKGRSGSCFAHQLKKCMGACCGKEPSVSYNLRVQKALHNLKQQQWPYEHAILLEEHNPTQKLKAFHLVDNWCYLGRIQSADELWSWQPIIESRNYEQLETDSVLFDLDIYFILVRFLLSEDNMQKTNLKIHLLNPKNMPVIHHE